MGTADKAKHAAEDLKGKTKEGAGNATNDDEMKAEGKKDQTKANVKKTGEDVKDVFKK
ncbi:CsbD family protein [Aeromicrobium sp.]|uniref:CsbD family protein n=1 Tax=Aeromicrobium sp. TaxID=1871063 RepID=UPI003D6BCE57